MTITACFNFIGATEVELDFAISDLLFFSAPRRPSDVVTEQQTWPLFLAQIHVIATYMIDLYE